MLNSCTISLKGFYTYREAQLFGKPLPTKKLCRTATNVSKDTVADKDLFEHFLSEQPCLHSRSRAIHSAWNKTNYTICQRKAIKNSENETIKLREARDTKKAADDIMSYVYARTTKADLEAKTKAKAEADTEADSLDEYEDEVRWHAYIEANY